MLRTSLFVPFLLLLVSLLRAADPAPAPASASADYVLQPSDLIRVQVFQEPDLLRELRISQDGTISLPLIKEVDLRNKTVRQAEEIIRARYDRDYLVNPQITIVVTEYAKRTVNVLGQVNSPGAILFPQEQKLTLLDAITRAGGFTRLANRKNVKLTRTKADGKTETFTIDATEQLKGGASTEKWLLQVGDTIFVQESFL